MVAKVNIKIGDKFFKRGEKVTAKLKKSDESFLKENGYVGDDEKSQETMPNETDGNAVKSDGKSKSK